jgi:tRNA (guanine-N7-)-methyltransferase
VLRGGGLLYTITDVQEVATWMRDKLAAHPLFEAVPETELAGDCAAAVLASATEEGQKVARNGGRTWRAVFRRVHASGGATAPAATAGAV